MRGQGKCKLCDFTGTIAEIKEHRKTMHAVHNGAATIESLLDERRNLQEQVEETTKQIDERLAALHLRYEPPIV